jgi:galactose mutarotase-like enzyme
MDMSNQAEHVLSSSALGGVEATYVPSAGMVCRSLTVGGQELLGQRGGLDRYVEEHGTMGVPLLHPWANRLSERRFAVGGTQLDVDSAGAAAATDPNGLPIHGLLAGHSAWEVLTAQDDRLHARFDFTAQKDLFGAFPFAHELEMDVRLEEATLTVVTMLRPTGDVAVPISFGYHPYFTLPGVPRAEWEVELPVREHIVVDDRMIPTGEREPAEGVEDGPLGSRTFDDGYDSVPSGARFAVSGGDRRIEVTFADGYPVAVVYAPDNDDVVCFEPMTAPTNALVSGDGLRTVEPGDEFRACFSVAVS